jgi:hypothetical protein
MLVDADKILSYSIASDDIDTCFDVYGFKCFLLLEEIENISF